MRVVRLRPGLIFKREAASEIRRFFLGPLLPNFLVRPRLIPFVPDVPRLRFQAVHADDVGEAYRRAVVRAVDGAFNIAAAPTIGPPELASLLHARRLPVPARLLRGAAALTWRAHLQPADAGWIDLALGVPLMDVSRARGELGWEPRSARSTRSASCCTGSATAAAADPAARPARRRTGALGEFATGIGSFRDAERHSMNRPELLAIYLNDHLAGSVGGVETRVAPASSQRGQRVRRVAGETCEEIESDRESARSGDGRAWGRTSR